MRKGVQGVTKEGEKLQNENENVTQVWGGKSVEMLEEKKKEFNKCYIVIML